MHYAFNIGPIVPSTANGQVLLSWPERPQIPQVLPEACELESSSIEIYKRKYDEYDMHYVHNQCTANQLPATVNGQVLLLCPGSPHIPHLFSEE
jgi:hypothetical protein